MDLLRFELLSRYPEITLDGNKYYRFPQIIALRFNISSIFNPTYIRIINNDEVIAEERVDKKKFFNIWLNLGTKTKKTNQIKIYLKIIGIYVRIRVIDYVIPETNDLYVQSDSYIDPYNLSNPNLAGKRLEAEIASLPSPIRNTVIDNSNKIVSSIILLRLDQLGDFVLTIPAICELKNLFPNAKITCLVSPANEEIAKSTGLFQEIITVQFSFIEKTNYRTLSQEAKNYVQSQTKLINYDIAIDLSPMPESREILGLINATRKFGFENTDTSMINFGLLIHAKDPINSLSNVPHAAYPLLLVDAVKRVLKPNFIRIPKLNDHNEILKKYGLVTNNYMVIHSGSRNLLIRWPIDNFITLASRLETEKTKIIFFSDDELNENNRNLLGKLNNCIIIDYKIDFEEFDILLSSSKIFIGNDSGPKHLAAMRGVPVISVHSPRTNWSEWGQIDSGCIVSKAVPCAGCAIINEEECARSLQCIKEISVNDVYPLVRKYSVIE